MPVFNEAATLNELLQQVLAAPYGKQVVVVNDKSTDETPQILENWRDVSTIEVLQHDRNRGKGAAIRTGLDRAIGQVVIIQDADLELDPSAYPDLIEPVLTDEVDFVIGSRFLGQGKSPRLHRCGVRLLNVAVRWLYGTRLTDEACCYKAMRTETLRAMDLQCEGFEFCPEVVAKASRMQLRMREVPVEYHPRTSADGKKLRLRDGAQALWTLWKWRHWSPDPLPPFSPEPLREADEVIAAELVATADVCKGLQ